METGGEVKEVEEPNEDNLEGSDEPLDGCWQLEGVSFRSNHTGDKKWYCSSFRQEVALLHHEHKSVWKVRKARFELSEETFPEIRAATAENAEREQEQNPEGS